MASARLVNDPDKYIRRIRGGRYQARPYLEGERYNLGTFPTQHAARMAISQFWWGKLRELPKHTMRISARGEDKFIAMIHFEGDGWTYRLGPYDTREQAAAAAAGICLGLYGPLFYETALQRTEHSIPPRLRRRKPAVASAVA